MTIRQIRAKLNTLKCKYALPLLILRIRRRSQIPCDDWANAEANNAPIPNTPLPRSQFAQDSPRSPTASTTSTSTATSSEPATKKTSPNHNIDKRIKI